MYQKVVKFKMSIDSKVQIRSVNLGCVIYVNGRLNEE